MKNRARYLTVKHAAILYHKSQRTILRWIEEGKIEAKKDPGGRGWLILNETNTPKEDRV